MSDQLRVSRIGQRPIQRADESEASISLAQEHHSPVAGDIAALETRFDFSPIKAWKNKQFVVTLWH
jgi:hypothetical protein